MTVRALSNSTSNPWLMPGAALLALALVALAWFVPMGNLGEGSAAPQRPQPIVADPASAIDARRLPPFGTPAWTALEPRLMALRDPVEKPVESAVVTDTTEGTPVETETRPVETPSFQVAWQYIGYIDDADGLRALITTASMRQRLIHAGETVTDETDPRAQNITVVSITPEELKLERDGRELTLERVEQPQTAGGFVPTDPRSAPGSRGTGQRPGVMPAQRPQRSREF